MSHTLVLSSVYHIAEYYLVFSFHTLSAPTVRYRRLIFLGSVLVADVLSSAAFCGGFIMTV